MKFFFPLIILLLITSCDKETFVSSERIYDSDNHEFTISGETGGNDVSLSFKLEKKEVFKNLSFGVSHQTHYIKYGGQKTINFLNPTALKTYQDEYVKPGKDCPAWFMNKNLQSLVLIASDEQIASQLENYDIPFDGRGTEFAISGHFMSHQNEKYLENGKNFSLRLIEQESITSNVGSAKRKINYFLVTDLEN